MGIERYGCIVETAHDGGEASYMVRSVALEGNYDVIVSSDDPGGPDIFVRFKPVNNLIEVRPLGLGSYENDTGVTDDVGSNATLERNITFAATGDGRAGRQAAAHIPRLPQ